MEIYVSYNYDINFVTSNRNEIKEYMLLNNEFKIINNEKLLLYSSLFPSNKYNSIKLSIISNIIYVLEVIYKTDEEINKEFICFSSFQEAYTHSIIYYNRCHFSFKCLRCNNKLSRKNVTCYDLSRMINSKKYSLFYNEYLITIKIYSILF